MKRMAVAGLALGSGLVLAGCGLGDLALPEREEIVGYDVTDAVAELEVDSGAGEVVVNGSDRTGVRVTETLHWRGDDKPTSTHPVEGSLLRLGYDCPDRIGVSSCSVDYKVEVPKGMKVNVETGSGTITLRRLSGTVSATSGAGDIDAADLAGAEGFAETGSGDIGLRYTAVPREVTVESGAGDSTVWLPQGGYLVDTSSGAGRERVEVRRDPSSSSQINVSTGAGDASVLLAR